MMQKDLETYEPPKETPEQELEYQDAPKRKDENKFVPSHEQDIEWLYELAQDREWKDVMIREFRLKGDPKLCTYLLLFRDEIVDHWGHESKQDLSRHFRNLMKDGDNRDGWNTLYHDSWAANQCTYNELKDEPLIKLMGLRLKQIGKNDAQIYQIK